MKRLLDLSTVPETMSFRHVRLVEDMEVAGAYICLSHCWGSPERHPIETTTENLSRHKFYIDFSELPRTFQEAAEVARHFAVRYLWIDSLCIVQDDEEDWRTQSAEMSDIYRGALFTIAATASPDSGYGLFHHRNLEHQGVDLSVLTGQHRLEGTFIRTPLHHATDANHRPLTSRGWVFQERVLSPRVLHFDMQELLWECTHETACECKDGAEHSSNWIRLRRSFQPANLQAASKEEIFELWHDAVILYSPLNLSREDDILPAISGLAKRLQSALNCTYLAGLW